jgi:hypothetical protein
MKVKREYTCKSVIFSMEDYIKDGPDKIQLFNFFLTEECASQPIAFELIQQGEILKKYKANPRMECANAKFRVREFKFKTIK